jgi:DNA-binding transcriptional MerR regulator
MRIAELSRQTGVPVPTIKYYLREGLLPPGELSSPNQARYDESHVRRLRLIRALLDVGRLPIAAIRDLLADLDRYDADPHRMLGQALRATEPVKEQVADATLAGAEAEVDELIKRRGWRVSLQAPARHSVARAIVALRQLDADGFPARLDEYAAAVEQIAAADLESIRHLTDRDAIVHRAVISTIIGDTLLAGLRRLAQEDASAKVFGYPRDSGDDGTPAG